MTYYHISRHLMTPYLIINFNGRQAEKQTVKCIRRPTNTGIAYINK